MEQGQPLVIRLINKTMKIIALIYLILFGLQFTCEPFIFGKSRGNYSPKLWLTNLFFNAPLFWLLFEIIKN